MGGHPPRHSQKMLGMEHWNPHAMGKKSPQPAHCAKAWAWAATAKPGWGQLGAPCSSGRLSPGPPTSHMTVPQSPLPPFWHMLSPAGCTESQNGASLEPWLWVHYLGAGLDFYSVAGTTQCQPDLSLWHWKCPAEPPGLSPYTCWRRVLSSTPNPRHFEG